MQDDDPVTDWTTLAERCSRNLAKHGFNVHHVSSIQEARSLILGMVSNLESFGFGGSKTIRALGIVEELRTKGKTVYDHWQEGLNREESRAIRLLQGRCDCFFCSANAISATGEIVNIDAAGNRTSAMIFGPKKVISVAGMSKVTPDLESALKRAQEIAAPMRARSLGVDTPCVNIGACCDCDSTQLICSVTTILHRRPTQTDISVILVDQVLGF